MSSMNAAVEPLETIAAAQRLGVSSYTLRKWRSQGCGPTFSKRGRKVVYSTTDLETYEKATRRNSTRGDHVTSGGASSVELLGAAA